MRYDRNVRPTKHWLARALGVTGVSRALMRAQSFVHRNGYVRVVNYHDTPPEDAAQFEEQVRFYAQHFSPVRVADLDRFYCEGARPGPKPGLVISFDDGLRSNYDVAAPILERYGFIGWFFVPTAFLDTPVEQQIGFARTQRVLVHRWPDHPRIAMSWEEVRTLAQRHVIGLHTRTHRRMAGEIAPDVLEDEIVHARADLETRIEKPVETFCWVGGEDGTYSTEAGRLIRRAGYRYAFMTNNAPIVPGTDPFQIQRTNVEASWPLHLVRFQLSGVMDLLYLTKRKRVNRLTEA